MVKIGNKMPNFCLNRIRPLARVRSPPSHATIDDLEKQDCFPGGGKVNSARRAGKKSGDLSCRKIMIVVDSSIHAKNAVQWALTHTVQNQDLVILLHVTKPCKKAEQSSKRGVTNPRIPEFLTRMKSLCQLKRPEVGVEVVVVERKEKGPTIVEAAQRKEVAMLVVGQKKRSVTWRLMAAWAGNRAAEAIGVAEYCVQNASCMAIAVRRKSKRVGGYLITTKRQKDFWLLA